ncbi:MAG TPA: PepSY domain-containing protein [Pseudomonas sp.]|jgi:uncharacterized membrane protein YkoI|nr:PepSY domain-containing protein [Pseudomonas sp.]
MPRTLPLLLVALLVAAPALAGRDLDQDEALRLRQEGVIQPLDALLRPLLERYPGARLLEAELEEEHGRFIYELELLTQQGEVRDIELDAGSGELLQDKED